MSDYRVQLILDDGTNTWVSVAPLPRTVSEGIDSYALSEAIGQASTGMLRGFIRHELVNGPWRPELHKPR